MSDETYNWNAEAYVGEASSEQQKWAAELVEKLALRGGERLLDIGCGDGRMTAEIARRLYKGFALGVDSSENMIRFASRHYENEKYPNLKFQIADARKLSFQNDFDVVFSNAVLHWVRDPSPVLNGIAKGLKSGGKALLQMGGAGNAAPVLEILARMLESERWREFFLDFKFPFGFYEATAYRKLLEQSGLKPIRIELIPKDMTHAGGAGLAKWISATWLPYVEPVPDEKREQFVAEFVASFVEKYPPDQRNLIHVPMIRLEVEAVKP